MLRRITSKLSIRNFNSFAVLRSASKPKVELEENIPGFREPAQVPTDYELAVGLERYELLKTLKGEDPWEDLHPIEITKKGTVKEPIHVTGVDVERYIGCTGALN